MLPPSDDDPPVGPIADFSAALHSQAESLLMDCPYALTPETPDAPAEQQPDLFGEPEP